VEFAAFRAELDACFASIEAKMDARFAGVEGQLSNLPTAIQLLFMQATLILELFVAAYRLLRLAGHG
jgi:hypothetical protein